MGRGRRTPRPLNLRFDDETIATSRRQKNVFCFDPRAVLVCGSDAPPSSLGWLWEGRRHVASGSGSSGPAFRHQSADDVGFELQRPRFREVALYGNALAVDEELFKIPVTGSQSTG